MDGVHFSATVELWAQTALMWVGFGTVVGLLAKAIMPGRDPGGAVATLLMGIGGSLIGCALLAYFVKGQRVTPISPLGLVVGIGGAFLLLAFYRVLGGYWFVEGEAGGTHSHRTHFRSRRAARYDE
jgi:uncharacterized membrane protein YeaQ/YmgE (transglycosylase-associated protein family)